MNARGVQNIAGSLVRIAALAAGCAAVAILAGCKGNTTSAAYAEHPVGKPPVVTIHPTAADPRGAGGASINSAAWPQHWLTLVAPANTIHTTTPTQATLSFDAQNLYVYFVSQQSIVPAFSDSVALYLDTTAKGDGTELFKISVDSTGMTQCTWYRGGMPAEPREESTPDLARPIEAWPATVHGLWSHVESADDHGKAIWTAVIALPLTSLPEPMRIVSPLSASGSSADRHWKFNLIRTIKTLEPAGSSGEQLQSNLSPVFVGSQEFSQQRLAELVIGQ